MLSFVNVSLGANSACVAKVWFWPSGAQATLRVSPSLSALHVSLRIVQIEEVRIEHPSGSAFEVID
jgi:hypothetical protein